MARQIRAAQLETRTARTKLPVEKKPYFVPVERGVLQLGYRRVAGGAGSWIVSHYVAAKRGYDTEKIGIADDYSDGDGVAILSWRQAVELARERMVQRAHSAAGKTGPLTVRDVVEDYLNFLDTNRKSGVDARHRAAAFIYPELGSIEVDALTTDKLNGWVAGLAKMPRRLRTKAGKDQQHREVDDTDEARRKRRSSANRVLTILKGALNRAWRAGKVSSDSAWRRVEPFEAVDAARIRYLSVPEAQRLINASAPDFRSLVRGALETGARYGELIALEAQDFNPDAGTIAIRQSKSGRPRHVVLTDDGTAFFAQHTAGRAGSDRMFLKANGQPWAPAHQARPMMDACRNGRITPLISFHGLRHTWASLAVMNGTPLMVVARNLGHADTRMVEKHYGHLAPSYVTDAIRAGAPRFGEAESANLRQIGARP